MKQCECATAESPNNISDSDGNTSTTCPVATTGCAGAGAVGESSTAVGAALGGVAAVLLLILMGVVMGWAWTCCRTKTMQR